MSVVKLYNLARMTTATTGTGTITLGSAATVNGVLYLTFAQAGISNSETVMYGIADTNNSEVGYGVYTSAGTTLSRAAILRSTNSNTAISLSGSAQVFILGLAEAALVGPVVPQGRLTLTTGTPVLTSTVSGATTVYYAYYKGSLVPIYNGTQFVNTMMSTELSQATTDTAKSPAACTTNSNYDVFVWSDSGTMRATRGPPWSSDTSRGTGAGTTELQRIDGIWTNAVNITNGPAANRGTYVGTFRTDGSSQVNFNFGGTSAGGTKGIFHVWNCYNRVNAAARVAESTDSWAAPNATWRAINNSSTMRVELIAGLNEDSVIATYLIATAGGGANSIEAVGLDTTGGYSGFPGGVSSTATGFPMGHCGYCGLIGLGSHYISANEFCSSSTGTGYGDAGVTYVQSGLTVTWPC